MRSFKLSVSVVMASAFVLSCGQAATTPNAKSPTANSASATATDNSHAANRAQLNRSSDVDEFADLYAEKCMICHKDTGKGGKLTLEGKTIHPANLTSPKMKAKTDEKLLAEIKDGDPDEGMPSFAGKLSDEEIKSIIQKIRSFQ